MNLRTLVSGLTRYYRSIELKVGRFIFTGITNSNGAESGNRFLRHSDKLAAADLRRNNYQDLRRKRSRLSLESVVPRSPIRQPLLPHVRVVRASGFDTGVSFFLP